MVLALFLNIVRSRVKPRPSSQYDVMLFFLMGVYLYLFFWFLFAQFIVGRYARRMIPARFCCIVACSFALRFVSYDILRSDACSVLVQRHHPVKMTKQNKTKQYYLPYQPRSRTTLLLKYRCQCARLNVPSSSSRLDASPAQQNVRHCWSTSSCAPSSLITRTSHTHHVYAALSYSTKRSQCASLAQLYIAPWIVCSSPFPLPPSPPSPAASPGTTVERTNTG